MQKVQTLADANRAVIAREAELKARPHFLTKIRVVPIIKKATIRPGGHHTEAELAAIGITVGRAFATTYTNTETIGTDKDLHLGVAIRVGHRIG